MNKATKSLLIGELGLLMWAIGASLVASLRALPPYEIIAVACFVSLLISILHLTWRKQWCGLLGRPAYLWIAGILGFCGNEVFYVEGFKHAPAAQAELVTQLWPLLLILLSAFLPKEKLSIKHLANGSGGIRAGTER